MIFPCACLHEVERDGRQPVQEALNMAIDFIPQFHRKLTQNGSYSVWVALPHPRTLIAAKTNYYRAWQREECAKLESAGEVVLAFAITH